MLVVNIVHIKTFLFGIFLKEQQTIQIFYASAVVQNSTRFPDYVSINYGGLELQAVLQSVSRQQIFITYAW